MSLQAVIIGIVVLLLLLRFSSQQSKAKRNQVIDAPMWARQYWHLVPDELRNSLTYGDWEGICKSQKQKVRTFCSDKEIREFAHPIVLSVTTSPTRIKWLSTVLNCLDLSCINEIAVNLPVRFGRNQQTYDVIPDHVVNYPKLKIYWHDVDDGPLMKIINTIDRATDPESICISIDDDICLARGTIQGIVSAQIAHKGTCVIGGRGTHVKRYVAAGGYQSQGILYEKLWPKNIAPMKPRDGFVYFDMLEGFGSISYRAKHLIPARLREFAAANKRCFTSDDITINTCLQEQGISRFMLHGIYLWPFSFGNLEDALHVIQKHNESYGVCIDNMKKVMN